MGAPMDCQKPQRSSGGFTVIELLVVIAVIAVLIALLVPAVQRARESANRTECLSNLKQIGLAMHGYHDVHKTFPNTRNGYMGRTWCVSIMPFIEHDSLYKQMFMPDPSLPLPLPNGDSGPFDPAHGIPDAVEAYFFNGPMVFCEPFWL